jgi:hypothetical protein
VLGGAALTVATVQPLIVMAGVYAVLGFLLFDFVLDD